MICPICGTQNTEGSRFCVRCGNNLNITSQSNQVNEQQNIINNEPQQMNYAESNYNSNNYQQPEEINTNEKMQYLFVIIAVILKPFTAFKEEVHKFNNFKNSIIMSLIMALLATILVLVQTMFTAVRSTSYFSTEVTWTWDNLKELDYVQIIGRNFLVYLGIILAIAAVYYIASLVAKKQTSFSKLLGIAATSISPMIICSLILSPLVSLIYAPLSMIISIIGIVYTVVIIYEFMNNEILLEGNAKFYLNLICLSILAIAIYYLYTRLFMSSVSLPNSVDSVLDMFGY